MMWDLDNAAWATKEATAMSDDSIEAKVLSDKVVKQRIKNDQLHTIKARTLKDLCILPSEGEQYRIITEKQFNAFAFLLYLLERSNIEELYLAIYRINEPTVDALIEMIESGKIKSAHFVISSFFNQTKRPEQWALKLRRYAETSPKCRHTYTHNHAKVVAVKTTDGACYVFEGSGNMSDNARIEQYTFERNNRERG